MKKLFSPKQKAIVALEALKGIKTINQVSGQFDAHPTQVGHWKKQLTDNAEQLFADKRKKESRTKDELIEQLYKVVGQRDIELEWLKKKLGLDSS
jgi:transposase-like protein